MFDPATWFFVSSGLFLGWSLGANHAVNVFGTAVVSKMVKFRVAAIIAGVFVVLGAVMSGAGTTQTINDLGPINAIAGSFAVAFAVGISVTIMTRVKLPVSTSQAVIGGIIGWNMFTGSPTDLGSLSRILSSWVVSPLIAAIFGYVLFILMKRTVLTWKIHLLEIDQYTRAGLIIVGALASYSLGANNIANVMGMFASAPLFSEISLAGIATISGVQQLFLLGGIAIAVGVFTYGRNVMETVGNDLYKISPLTGLIVVLVEFIVLTLFTSVTIESFLLGLGLPTIPLVPLSTTQAFIGAILGVGLAKDPSSINFKVLGKIAIGWVVAPVSACILTFFLLFFVQNVFEQKVIHPVPHELSPAAITAMERENIPTAPLADLAGQRFYNKKVLRNELTRRYGYTNAQLFTIFQYALIDSFRIDSSSVLLQRPGDVLTDTQRILLKPFHNTGFSHALEFHEFLAGRGIDFPATGNAALDKQHDQHRRTVERAFRVQLQE